MPALNNQSLVTPPDYIRWPKSTHADQVPLNLDILDDKHPERREAEIFVHHVFKRAFGARLNQFYPLLLRITLADGRFAAVAGIRPAGSQKLFSEYYLKHPVEQQLGIPRQQIVEVGNLAPASVGQARWLIGMLTVFLAAAKFSHVVFTGVPRLRNAFSRMGLPLVKLAGARPDALPEKDANIWGSYYDQNPAVFSGEIQIGFDAFRQVITTRPEMQAIFNKAHEAGLAFVHHPLVAGNDRGDEQWSKGLDLP